jgi:carbon-monoxide dehydrogenase large subunit
VPTKSPNRASVIGAPLRRTEDIRLTTGRGIYTSDVAPDRQCYAVLVRSPHAHAKIRAIDTTDALAAPGVLTVLTGADAVADGLRPIPHNPDWMGPPDATLRLPDGFDVFISPNHALPPDIVRYVGEAAAMVVAETLAAAADAAELVDIDYEPLPTIVDARAALAPGAPQIWPDCPGNLALTCEVGDKDATDRAFEDAAHIVTLDSWVHRVTGSPMEPRTALGDYDAETDHYTLRAGSGRSV